MSLAALLTREAKEKGRVKTKVEGATTIEGVTAMVIIKVTKKPPTRDLPDNQDRVIILEAREVRDTTNLPSIQTKTNKVVIMAKGDIMVTISSSRIGSRAVLIREAQTI